MLLPFRGHREGEPGGAPEGGDTTVVHLTGRRRPTTAPADSDRRHWARVAVVAASAALVAGGATAAALTGVLPVVTERPVPRPAVSAPQTSAGAEVQNGPAAYGLCKAFDRAAVRGDDVAASVAFRNLANAAGGASNVSAYCAPFENLAPGRAR